MAKDDSEAVAKVTPETKTGLQSAPQKSTEPLTSVAAKEIPKAAAVFEVTPDGGAPVDVLAIDETDAIATWLQRHPDAKDSVRRSARRKA